MGPIAYNKNKFIQQQTEGKKTTCSKFNQLQLLNECMSDILQKKQKQIWDFV